jgi:hypothetical protein
MFMKKHIASCVCKFSQVQVSTGSTRTSKLLDLMHNDVCGPMQIQSLVHLIFFISLMIIPIDNDIYIFIINQKSFKIFKHINL